MCRARPRTFTSNYLRKKSTRQPSERDWGWCESFEVFWQWWGTSFSHSISPGRYSFASPRFASIFSHCPMAARNVRRIWSRFRLCLSFSHVYSFSHTLMTPSPARCHLLSIFSWHGSYQILNMHFHFLSVLLCFAIAIAASPYDENGSGKKIVTSSGCAWCTPGPWTFDPGKSSISFNSRHN